MARSIETVLTIIIHQLRHTFPTYRFAISGIFLDADSWRQCVRIRFLRSIILYIIFHTHWALYFLCPCTCIYMWVHSVTFRCVSNLPTKQTFLFVTLTSVWTMLTRWDLSSRMQLKMSTTPSFSAMSNMMSTAMKHPVLPAPALQRQ